MTNSILRGKPDTGNPHVRFDEGKVASEKPRRGSLLYKKLLILLAIVAAMSGMAAEDLSIVVNGTTLHYSITYDGVVIGTGSSSAIGSYSGGFDIPSEIDGRKVVGISARAFYGCQGLTRISIPATVKSIGKAAFWNCTSLTAVDIPEGVTSIAENAFKSCSGLKSLRLPRSVLTIGEDAFYGCAGLGSSVVYVDGCALRVNDYSASGSIPEGTRLISDGAFSNLFNIQAISIPASVERIGESAFYGLSKLSSVHISDLSAWCRIYFASSSANPMSASGSPMLYLNGTEVVDLIIPDGVTSIGNYAFSYGKKLKSVVIPSCVTGIGVGAFEYCTGLTSVRLCEGVSHIGRSAFAGCRMLEDIILPQSLMSIGNFAFEDCERISVLIMPKEMKSIGSFCFRDCSMLTAFEIPEGVESLGESTFANCTSLESIGLPSTMTNVGQAAFKECRALKSVNIKDLSSWVKVNFKSPTDNPCAYSGTLTLNGADVSDIEIPSGVSRIGSYVFYNVNSLRSVIIPEGVEEIGPGAFEGSGISFVRIPSTVRYVGSNAFAKCRDLKDVEIWDSAITATPGGSANQGNLYFSGTTVRSLRCVGDVSGYFLGGLQESVTNLCILARSIPSRKFQGFAALKNITFPNDGVSFRIQESAFADCTSIAELEFGTNCNFTAYESFLNCTNLQAVKVLGRNGHFFQWTDNPGRGVFAGCKNVRKYTTASNPGDIGYVFPDSYKTIEHVILLPGVTELESANTRASGGGSYFPAGQSLNGMEGLEKIVIPEGCEVIGQYAFLGCKNLAEISIPQSVTNIGCAVMTNTAWYARQSEGVLVQDGCVLGVKGRCTKSVVLPEGCRLICDECFIGHNEIAEFVLPTSLAVVGNYAFCTIPFGSSAVYSAVLKVYFNGDAPKVCAENIYNWAPFDTTSYVKAGSRGWNAGHDGIPDQWKERPIARWNGTFFNLQFYDDPLEACLVARANEKLLFVLSGADWCPYTAIVRNYLIECGEDFDKHFVVYYCNVDTDVTGMADGVPSYGVFDPAKFNMNWHDGLLSYGSGGVENFVRKAIDEGIAKYEADQRDFAILFDDGSGARLWQVMECRFRCVYKLPNCTLKPPAGKTRFAGWACSNGRRYDDGMLVFDLAKPGETVTMTAIWE